VLKLKHRERVSDDTPERTRKERDRMQLGRAVAPEDVTRVRLTWYAPFLEELMRTLRSEKASEYRASVLTSRYIEMARQRVSAKHRVRTITNPHTNSVFVWVEKKK